MDPAALEARRQREIRTMWWRRARIKVVGFASVLGMLLQAAFCALLWARLDNLDSPSWEVVFLPLWARVALMLATNILKYQLAAESTNPAAAFNARLDACVAALNSLGFGASYALVVPAIKGDISAIEATIPILVSAGIGGTALLLLKRPVPRQDGTRPRKDCCILVAYLATYMLPWLLVALRAVRGCCAGARSRDR